MRSTGFHLSKLISSFIIIFSLAACGGGGGSEEPAGDPADYQDQPPTVGDGGGADRDPADFAKQIHALAIAGAQGFAITGERGEVKAAAKPSIGAFSTAAASTAVDELSSLEPETLYKVNPQGQLERVQFLDDAGTELARGAFKPLSLVEVGPDFVHLVVEFADYHQPLGLLVSKETGRAFFSESVFGDPYWFENDRYVQALANHFRFDAAGNVYFLRGHGWDDGRYGTLLNKMNIGNAESGDLTAAPLQQNHVVMEFELSAKGEFLIYRGYNQNHDSEQIVYDMRSEQWLRLATVPGLPSAEHTPGGVVRGLDGDLYLTYNLYASGEPNFRLYRLSRESGQIVATDLGQLKGSSTSSPEDVASGYSDAVAGFVDSTPTMSSLDWDEFLRGRMVVNGLLMYSSYYLSRQLLEVDLPNRTVVAHDTVMNAFNTERSLKLYPTDRYLWMVGTSATDGSSLIVRYNPASREIKELPFDPNFELHKMEPLSSNHVMFDGIRLNDQRRVVGQMDLDGNLLRETIHDAAEVPITVMRAILPADFIRVDGSVQDWDISHRILNGETGGPAGHDLSHYSSLSGRGYYYGLVEFSGAIDAGGRTRIVFDTHTVIVGAGGVQLITGDGAAVDVPDGQVSLGEAVEFSLPVASFGQGANPVLKAVERVDVQPLLNNVSHNWSGGVLTVDLDLNAHITNQTIVVSLSDSYAVIITGDGAEVIDPDGTPSPVSGFSYQELDDGSAAVTVEVEVALLGGVERSLEDVVADPDSAEILQDTLQ